MRFRKFIPIFILALLCSFSVYADVILIKDNIDHGVFTSPARIVDIDKTTPFGFRAELISDIDELDFLNDPVSSFEKASKAVADYLSEQGSDFWYEHSNLASDLASLDPSFPVKGTNEELYIKELQEYFSGRFLSDEYGNNNRTLAVADVFDNGVYPPGLEKTMGGDMDLGLSFFGGDIANGFGWDVGFDLYLDSAGSLLSNYTDGDWTYGNDLAGIIYADLGFATYVIDDVLAIGLSVSPELFFRTTFLNSDIINARMENQILNIFAQNNYYFGAGIGLNFGFMYKPLDNLSLSFDLRNAPAIKGAIYFNASDVASGSFSLKPDENIYFTPPDFAVSVKWDYDKWHIEGEINDWVSQLIWMSKVKGLEFKWWYIPDIRVAYDVSESLTLSLLYENDMLGLGFECGGFTADLLTKLDRFAIGIRMGYVI